MDNLRDALTKDVFVMIVFVSVFAGGCVTWDECIVVRWSRLWMATPGDDYIKECCVVVAVSNKLDSNVSSSADSCLFLFFCHFTIRFNVWASVLGLNRGFLADGYFVTFSLSQCT